MARIQISAESRIGFDRDCGERDFCFVENLDMLNFSELPENTLLDWKNNPNLKLSVAEPLGKEMESVFPHYEGNEIRLKRSVIPSMLTTNESSVY